MGIELAISSHAPEVRRLGKLFGGGKYPFLIEDGSDIGPGQFLVIRHNKVAGAILGTEPEASTLEIDAKKRESFTTVLGRVD